MNNIQTITQYAIKALLYEVLISPKPGLVDRLNNGSHNDMDTFTFIDAISALSPYMKLYIDAGFKHNGTPKELFQKSRAIGFEAETRMLEATNQINTHKGANFTFALVLCATGYLLKEKRVSLPFDSKDTQSLFNYVASMSYGLVTQDFSKLDEKEKLSYGENLYLKYGISGIRGVAEEGYPMITEHVMPYLRENLREDIYNKEAVFLHALTLIMSETEDTNLIHRGGIEAYEATRHRAKEIFSKHTPLTIRDTMESFDESLIEQHISPGGAADLLSLSIFIAHLEGLF